MVVRQKSVEIILKKMKELNVKELSQFKPEISILRKRFLDAASFENLQEAAAVVFTKPYGGTATWNGFKFNEKPTEQIDFIFRVKKQYNGKKV